MILVTVVTYVKRWVRKDALPLGGLISRHGHIGACVAFTLRVQTQTLSQGGPPQGNGKIINIVFE